MRVKLVFSVFILVFIIQNDSSESNLSNLVNKVHVTQIEHACSENVYKETQALKLNFES